MKILSRPKGNAEEYGRWSVNPYKGCSHGCEYCYLKEGAWAKGLGGNTPVLKKNIVNAEHAYHVAMAEIIENREQIIKDGGLFFTFTSDPCMPETCELTFKIASDAMAWEIPVTLLTKDANFCGKDNPIVQSIDTVLQVNKWLTNIVMDFENTHKERLAIGFTLTGHDELEPNASPNEERVKAIEYLNNEGWKTWASIEPVIDFKSSYDMILAACDAGCRHFKIGLMTKKTKVCRKMYDHDACIEFIHDVMRVMEAGGGTATVYWKQSFRDFLGEEDFARATVGYKNIVGKDWSMFNMKSEEFATAL